MAKFTRKVKNILQRKWLGATLLGGSVAKAQIGFYLVLMLIKLHIQMWVEWLHILSDSSLIKSSNDPKKKKILSKSTRYCRPAGSWEFLKSVLFFLFFRPSLELFHFGQLFIHACFGYERVFKYPSTDYGVSKFVGRVQLSRWAVFSTGGLILFIIGGFRQRMEHLSEKLTSLLPKASVDVVTSPPTAQNTVL